MSLGRPILEYAAACWDPYREDKTKLLERVQELETKYANRLSDSVWENLAWFRKRVGVCRLFRAYSGERAWKGTENMLQGPCYLSRDDHDRKISVRK
jgi:hypothetical protein